MAKLSLLDIVQRILTDKNGNSVNSIDDSVEATDIAYIVRDTYEDIISTRNWPHLLQPGQFSAYGTSRPTHIVVPDNVKELVSLKYDKRKITDTKAKYEGVKYKDPVDFLNLLNSRDSSASDVTSIEDLSGFTLLIKTDKAPDYWTSFDDKHIVFDSYDIAVDANIRESKQQVLFYREPDFKLIDSFVPDLPSEAFPQFLSECKQAVRVKMNQETDVVEGDRTRRGRQWNSRKAWVTQGGIKYPQYGRKSPRLGRSYNVSDE